MHIFLQETNSWQPFYNSANYSVRSTENNFLSRLRGLYLSSSVTTSESILQQLSDLCPGIHPSAPLSSPHTGDTVIRAVLAIIGEIRTRRPSTFDPSTNVNMAELTTFYLQLNRSSHVRREEMAAGDVHEEMVKHRARELHASMEVVRIILERPDYIESYIPSYRYMLDSSTISTTFLIERRRSRPRKVTVPFSESISLWPKLKNKSATELLEENDEQTCPVCKDQELATINFAILDQCKHLFCAPCIKTCFNDR